MSGDLQSVDGYMNIALERCKEIADGRVIRNWGDAFVRGNNGKINRFLNQYYSTDPKQSRTSAQITPKSWAFLNKRGIQSIRLLYHEARYSKSKP